MFEQPNDLYLKLLGETAAISWQELQPFFARGALLHVAAGLDLVQVAAALARDDQQQVARWLQSTELVKLSAEQAQQWQARNPSLWAVVVAPWVLAQEHDADPSRAH